MRVLPNRPTAASSPAPLLSWLGHQLLLVPEAALLPAILVLYAALGGPLLVVVGLLLTLGFLLRAALLGLGRRALAAADYERAARLAAAALRLHPRSADAHALAGTIALARGDAPQAAVAFQRAVSCYPLQAELHGALSAALLDAGSPHEAREAAHTALTCDGRSAAAHLHLANAEEQLGAAPCEVEALLRAGLALAAPPADEAALRCTLAVHLSAHGRVGEAMLALAGVERLLEGCPAPQRAGLHFFLGELLRAGGDAEAARVHYRASEALDPHGRHAAAAWRAARS